LLLLRSRAARQRNLRNQRLPFGAAEGLLFRDDGDSSPPPALRAGSARNDSWTLRGSARNDSRARQRRSARNDSVLHTRGA